MIDLKTITKAAALASARVNGPVEFAYRDPDSGILYITERMFEQIGEDITDIENVIIVKSPG